MDEDNGALWLDVAIGARRAVQKGQVDAIISTKSAVVWKGEESKSARARSHSHVSVAKRSSEYVDVQVCAVVV